MARKYLLLLALIGMTSAFPAVCPAAPDVVADDQRQIGSAAPEAAEGPGVALLYLYRKASEDDAYHVADVQLDNGPSVDIEEGTHVLWRIEPGRHSITTNDNLVTLEAKAGETYYLLLSAERSHLGRWFHPLTLVAAEEGRKGVAGTVLPAEKKQQERPVRPPLQPVETTGTFRFEPSLFLGIGSTEVDVGTTTTGDPVRISGGGGAGLGMTIGYGLSRSFDLDATVGYQKSEMTPEVQNADASFDRTFFLITLKYRIPVQDRHRIKLGVGAGYYRPGDLDIDTSQVPGGNRYVVNYDDATGFHATAEWEIFLQPRLSLTIGGKYYQVNYKETGGTLNGAPVFFTDEKIKNFDGTGFDFTFGVSFYYL